MSKRSGEDNSHLIVGLVVVLIVVVFLFIGIVSMGGGSSEPSAMAATPMPPPPGVPVWNEPEKPQGGTNTINLEDFFKDFGK